MTVPKPVERIYHRSADRLFARLPQAVPSPEQARHCRIVSHRGEHDIRMVPENTLAAFDAARDDGVWGIEGENAEFGENRTLRICEVTA